MISASHNPFEDNGIKVFSGAGEKFTETLEQQVESIVADRHGAVPDGAAAAGRASRSALRVSRSPARDPAARSRIAGMRMAIDCANGATTTVAPRLFEELGFDVQLHR